MSHFSPFPLFPFSFGPVCLVLTAQYRLPFVLIVMSSRGKEWIIPSFFFLLEPQPSRWQILSLCGVILDVCTAPKANRGACSLGCGLNNNVFLLKKKICEVFNQKHEFRRGSLYTTPNPAKRWLTSPWVSAFVALCVAAGYKAMESSWTWKAGELLFSCVQWILQDNFEGFLLSRGWRFVVEWWWGQRASRRKRDSAKGLKITAQESASWNACVLKMVKTADAGEQSVFVKHLPPNCLSFKRGKLHRPPTAFLTALKGHLKTDVIKRGA